LSVEFQQFSWARIVTLRAYGTRIGIRITDARTLEAVLNVLPFGWRPTDAGPVDRLYSLTVAGEGPGEASPTTHAVYSDDTKLFESPNLSTVLGVLEQHLQLYVAEMSPTRIFVHCGVVGWKGRAILLPGRSHAGKTTLVVELVRAGATYYSDEYAVLDRQGRVHPYARALRIRDSTGSTVERRAVEALGGRAGRKPLPVGLVVASSFRIGAAWRPRKLSPGRGVLELLSNTVPARQQPHAVLTTLHYIVAHAPVLKGVRGEADAVAPLVLALLND
jgi:hypothetical protein